MQFQIGDNSAINLLAVLSGLVYAKDKRGFENLLDDDGVFDFKKYDKDFTKYSDSIIARAKR